MQVDGPSWLKRPYYIIKQTQTSPKLFSQNPRFPGSSGCRRQGLTFLLQLTTVQRSNPVNRSDSISPTKVFRLHHCLQWRRRYQGRGVRRKRENIFSLVLKLLHRRKGSNLLGISWIRTHLRVFGLVKNKMW